MRPWCKRFGGERNAKKNEKLTLIVKIQQAAPMLFPRVPGNFFLRISQQKKQKIGGKNWRNYFVPLYLVYVSHQGRFGQPRTNWRRGRLQKATTTRDRCVVHMCASSVLSRRATSPAPAQRKTAAIQPHPDGITKKQISYFGDPQTGEVY